MFIYCQENLSDLLFKDVCIGWLKGKMSCQNWFKRSSLLKKWLKMMIALILAQCETLKKFNDWVAKVTNKGQNDSK